MQKDKLGDGVGGHFQKNFIQKQKQSFKPIFLSRYLSNEKSIFDNSMAEPNILSIGKYHFLKIFSGHFYGQFFIKTVRGPFRYSLRIREFGKFCLRGSNPDNVFFFLFFLLSLIIVPTNAK